MFYESDLHIINYVPNKAEMPDGLVKMANLEIFLGEKGKSLAHYLRVYIRVMGNNL